MSLFTTATEVWPILQSSYAVMKRRSDPKTQLVLLNIAVNVTALVRGREPALAPVQESFIRLRGNVYQHDLGLLRLESVTVQNQTNPIPQGPQPVPSKPCGVNRYWDATTAQCICSAPYSGDDCSERPTRQAKMDLIKGLMLCSSRVFDAIVMLIQALWFSDQLMANDYAVAGTNQLLVHHSTRRLTSNPDPIQITITVITAIWMLLVIGCILMSFMKCCDGYETQTANRTVFVNMQGVHGSGGLGWTGHDAGNSSGYSGGDGGGGGCDGGGDGGGGDGGGGD